MKKLITFLAGSLCYASSALATLDYTLAVSSPGFTPLSSPTNISDFGCACQDQIVSQPINIGFSFMYDGVAYTQFEVSDNGQLFLGAPAYSCSSNCGGTCNFSEEEPANLANGTDRNVICPLWDDLGFNNCSASVNYQLSGSPGSQVMTVEWLLIDWKVNNSGNPHGAISFQVKLYEAVPGQIDFIYRQDAQPLGVNNQAPHARIGLMGATGDYYSTDETGIAPSKTNEYVVTAKPADGIMFRWTPSSTTLLKTNPAAKWSIYPNPVLNDLFIDSPAKAASIEVYNETGVKVISAEMRNAQPLHIGFLPPGIYMIRINGNEGKRFIKS